MPTIYANSNDGFSRKDSTTHAGARDATSADSVTTNATQNSIYLYFKQPGRGGGSIYTVRRSFFYFDTSGITSTVSSATFNLFRTGLTPTGDAILVKSNAFGGDGLTALSTNDHDAFPGFSAGNTMSGNVTDYSQKFTMANVWTSGLSYSSGGVTLNSDALSDMVSNDYLIFALVNSDYDYKNIDPAGSTVGSLAPFYTTDFTGTDRDPKIDYTLASGYSNDVIGVASGDISEINAVATANVGELNGL